MHRLLLSVAALPLVGLSFGCARGGSDDTPQSEVQITATHHLFGLRSLAGFVEVPIDPANVVSTRGTFTMSDDSSYRITQATGGEGDGSYALTEAGELTVLVPGVGRDPSVVFLGGYTLTGATPGIADVFFTDRVTTTNSPSIGLFVGTRVFGGTPNFDLDGWHLGSIHVMFDRTLSSPTSVARAAFGSLTVTGGAGGAQGAIDGDGQQGTSTLDFGGTIQAIEQSGTFDGSCNLTLDYTLLNQPTDSRTFLGAASPDIVLALDEEEGDGEAGLAMMIRKFDITSTPSLPADPDEVDGTFYIGGYTTFVDPTNPGSDSFVGLLTLGTSSGASPGAFRLDATGSGGIDFTYQGTYNVLPDGKLTITISGTNEVWTGAIDREYKTIMIVDDFEESRSNGQIELNFVVGVRQKDV